MVAVNDGGEPEARRRFMGGAEGVPGLTERSRVLIFHHPLFLFLFFLFFLFPRKRSESSVCSDGFES